MAVSVALYATPYHPQQITREVGWRLGPRAGVDVGLLDDRLLDFLKAQVAELVDALVSGTSG
jgi:hypothetical protein